MDSEVTALVTGASRDIGRRIALTLADRGMNVAAAERGDDIYETIDMVDDSDRGLAVESSTSRRRQPGTSSPTERPMRPRSRAWSV